MTAATDTQTAAELWQEAETLWEELARAEQAGAPVEDIDWLNAEYLAAREAAQAASA